MSNVLFPELLKMMNKIIDFLKLPKHNHQARYLTNDKLSTFSDIQTDSYQIWTQY